MKKLILPIIVIAALAVAPWVVGNKSQQQLETTLARVSQNTSGVSYEITEYNKTVFNSTGKVVIKYDEAVQAQFNDETPEELRELFKNGFVFDINVAHGPIITKPSVGLGLSHIEFSLDTSSEPLKSFVEKAKITELLYGDIFFGLSGGGDVNTFISNFNFTEEDQSIQFGGAEIHQSFDNDLNYLGEGVIETLTFSGDGANLSTSPITLDFKGKVAPELNWGVGTFTSKMDSLEFTEATEGNTGNVKNLMLSVDISEASEGLFDMQYAFSVDEVNGSSLENPITNINYDMTIKNLSKAAMLSMNQINGTTDPTLSDEEQIMKIQEQTKRMGEEFLKHSPNIVLDAFAFKYGSDIFVDMTGDFGIDGDMISDVSMLQANPIMAIPALKANLDASFSESVISEAMQMFSMQQMGGMELTDEDKAAMKAQQEAQAEMMIAQFVQLGYLTKNEKGLATKATFENGQLNVNGNPMPFGF